MHDIVAPIIVSITTIYVEILMITQIQTYAQPQAIFLP